MATRSSLVGLVRAAIVFASTAITALVSCSSGQAAIKDRAALDFALKNARGGEILRLAEGDFGTVRVNNRRFPQPITIMSDRPERQATISRLVMNGVSGVSFVDIAVGGARQPGEEEYSKIAEVRGSANLSFKRVYFHGSLDGNPANDTWGAYFGDSSDILIDGSRFQELMRGAVFERSRSIRVIGNDYRMIRSDGLNFTSAQNVLVDRNEFSGFRPIGSDHADAIQFWNLKGAPSTDIVISNNVVIDEGISGPQGIFMNAAKTGPYQRVRIINNMLYSNGSWHGILIEDAEDVEISGNSTLSTQRDDKNFWIKAARVNRALITGNVTERLIVEQVTNSTISKNRVLPDTPSIKRQLSRLEGKRLSVADLIVEGAGYQIKYPMVGR